MDRVLTKYPDISRLTDLLEHISVSLHTTKDTVRDGCDLSRNLLRCWYLPSNEEQPICLCSSAPHQKMQTLLQKVEQAVHYSKSLREGRSDVPVPWEDNKECDKPNSPVPEKKVVSRTGLKPAVPRSKVVARPLSSVNGSINRKTRPSIGIRDKEDSQNCDMNGVNIDCPLHSSTCQRVEPAMRQVSLAEALDVKGIPPELVTILKTFHRYVDHHRGVRKKSKSAASFLRRAATLNEDAATTLEPIRYFAESLKSKQELEPLDHWSTEDSNFPSAGIWHPSIEDIFRGSPLVLRYRNQESLRELHVTLQSLQLNELQLQVSEILLNDVLPHLLKMSPSDPVLPLYLKTVTALSAMPPWCMPALVRTTRSRTQDKT